jgi:hypothetical protein
MQQVGAVGIDTSTPAVLNYIGTPVVTDLSLHGRLTVEHNLTGIPACFPGCGQAGCKSKIYK